MSVFWTIVLVLAILAAVYTITILLAWGLIHGARSWIPRRPPTTVRTGPQ